MSDTCEYCGSALAGGPGKGRPRKYCGDACRQAAHRRRTQGSAATPPTAPANTPTEPVPARTCPGPRTAVPSAGDEIITEIARDLQDGARDLARLLPSANGTEPLHRIAQLQEQLEGLTAAVVARARHRRVTWDTVGSVLRISEDTARHRYSERYILRRLARFNRSATPLTSLAAVFGSPPARPADPADAAAGGGDTAGDSGDPATERVRGPDQSAPSKHSGAAYNRLAPILSMLIRTAQLTNKEVSGRIGCSPSYLSRILSGERVPTWSLTRKFAQACGADPDVLRTVWESEKLSEKNRRTPPAETDDTPLSALERLRTAVHTLHLRAGRPAPNDIAVASRWLLSTAAAASILDASSLPHPALLETFVRVLGGDTDHFDQLLDDARTETAQHSARLQSPAPPQPSPARRSDIPPSTHPVGADTVMRTFSKVLTEDHTVEDGRARLLSKLARQQAASDDDSPRSRLLQAVRRGSR